MIDDRKQKMIDLGSYALADALLNLAMHSDETDDLIEAGVLTQDEGNALISSAAQSDVGKK